MGKCLLCSSVSFFICLYIFLFPTVRAIMLYIYCPLKRVIRGNLGLKSCEALCSFVCFKYTFFVFKGENLLSNKASWSVERTYVY